MKKTKEIVLLAFAILFLYGCEVALIGLGAGGGVLGYRYLEGHASRDYPLTYSKAWDVTNTALQNLEMSVSKSNKKETKGSIVALQKDGTSMTIKLRKRGDWVTTISVSGGWSSTVSLSKSPVPEKVLDEITSVAGL
jgi:hypothetical protein